MVSSGMLHRVALVRADVSEELSTSFISVTRIGELGTMLAVTSNRRSVALTGASVKIYLLGHSKRSDFIYSEEWRFLRCYAVWLL
jgi:hypothetical protein